jgi:hypothetical protein
MKRKQNSALKHITRLIRERKGVSKKRARKMAKRMTLSEFITIGDMMQAAKEV